MDLVKVSSQSHPRKTAGAIAGLIRDQKHVEIQAIGAGAINQAVKSMVAAQYYLQEDGIQIAFTVSMVDVEIVDRFVTAVRFSVEPNSVVKQ